VSISRIRCNKYFGTPFRSLSNAGLWLSPGQCYPQLNFCVAMAGQAMWLRNSALFHQKYKSLFVPSSHQTAHACKAKYGDLGRSVLLSIFSWTGCAWALRDVGAASNTHQKPILPPLVRSTAPASPSSPAHLSTGRQQRPRRWSHWALCCFGCAPGNAFKVPFSRKKVSGAGLTDCLDTGQETELESPSSSRALLEVKVLAAENLPECPGWLYRCF
jgi:hypothetical protein